MEQLTNDQQPKKRRRIVSSSPIVTEHKTDIESSPGAPEQASPYTQPNNLDSNKVSHHGNARNKSKNPIYGCLTWLSGFLLFIILILIALTGGSFSSSEYSSTYSNTYKTNKEYRDTVDETARVYDMSSEEVDASIQRILREINK